MTSRYRVRMYARVYTFVVILENSCMGACGVGNSGFIVCLYACVGSVRE